MFRAFVPAVFSLLILTTTLTPTADGQLTAVGESFFVAAGTGEYAYEPQATSLGNEGFAVVWRDVTPHARLFDDSGRPLSEGFEVSDSRAFSYSLRTAALSDGEFVVAWQSPSPAGVGSCFQLQQIADGEPVGDLEPTCNENEVASRPAVAAFPDGGLVLGWDVELDGPDGQEVRARVYGADGDPGSSFRVSAAGYGPSERLLADVGAWEDGFTVLWRDHPEDSTSGRLRAHRYHRSGESIDGSFPVSDRTDQFSGSQVVFSLVDGRVAINRAGRSVFVWSEPIGDDETDRLIMARVFDEAGESLGPPFVAHRPGPEESASYPEVAIDSAGSFVIAWHGRFCNFPCINAELKARLFNRFGDALGPAATVSRGGESPTIAFSDTGDILFAYTEGSLFFDPIWARLFRAEVDSTCMPDERTLCLNDGRFEVQVDWERPNGNTGVGRVVPAMSIDTGIFWFFDADNWELLVKVLNSCERTGHYWVFSAATTNVRYELTVTDMLTLQQRTYVNQQGVAAPAVTDTAAFATCP